MSKNNVMDNYINQILNDNSIEENTIKSNNWLDITPLIDQAEDKTEIRLLKNKIYKFSRKYKYFYNKIFRAELNNLINHTIKRLFPSLEAMSAKEEIESIKNNIYTIDTNSIFNKTSISYKKFMSNHDKYFVSSGEILLVSRMNIVPRTENISIQTHVIFPVMCYDSRFINSLGEEIDIDPNYDKIIPLHPDIQETFKDDFNI